MSAARRFGSPTDGRADMQTKLRSAAWWMVAALAVVLGSGCELAAPEIRGYAIVFGASEYLASPLPSVENDATEMDILLRNQGWEVSLYRDWETSKDQLQESIAEIPKAARENGMVLFYYAGHGSIYLSADPDIAPEYYLLPVPAIINTWGYIDSSELIAPQEIFDLLAEYNVRHPILILDSCFSGGFISETGVHDGITADYYPWSQDTTTDYAFAQLFALAADATFARLSYTQSGNAVVLAAAGSLEESAEENSDLSAPYYGHGIFTYYLLQAAADKKADINNDDYISIGELLINVQAALDANWNVKKKLSPKQVYMPRLSGSHRDYLLFKLP
ncbi:MAG: caspase family protein [Spirochaetes bacterium]|nr:caspase family protein [Spirochaetota bacterium]